MDSDTGVITSTNKCTIKHINCVRIEESEVICDMSRWKEYSKALVDIFGLVTDEDKNKILSISTGSGEYEFTVVKTTYRSDIKLQYFIDPQNNKIVLNYSKNIHQI